MMMLGKVLLALAAPPVAAVMVGASMTWVVVDVREGGPDGMHIVVPAPLALARAGLAFAPEEARRVELPEEAAKMLPVAAALVAALERAGDGDLVTVDDGDDHVAVRLEGGELRIDVDSDGDKVAVAVPLRAVRRILESAEGGELRTQEVLAALSSAEGARVKVRSGGDQVSVRLW